MKYVHFFLLPIYLISSILLGGCHSKPAALIRFPWQTTICFPDNPDLRKIDTLNLTAVDDPDCYQDGHPIRFGFSDTSATLEFAAYRDTVCTINPITKEDMLQYIINEYVFNGPSHLNRITHRLNVTFNDTLPLRYYYNELDSYHVQLILLK